MTLHDELGDRRGLAEAHHLMGVNEFLTGDLKAGRAHFNESIALSWEQQDTNLLCFNYRWLANLLLYHGLFAESRVLYEEYLNLIQSPEDRQLILSLMAYSLAHEGRYESARRQHAEVSSQLDPKLYLGEYGNHAFYASVALLGMGSRSDALRLLAESVPITEQKSTLWFQTMVRATLLIAEPRAESVRRTIELAARAGTYVAYLTAIPAVASYYLAQGEIESAVELYALASQHGFVANSAWYEDLVGRPIAEAARELPDDLVSAARSRGAQRELESTIAELAVGFAIPDETVSPS